MSRPLVLLVLLALLLPGCAGDDDDGAAAGDPGGTEGGAASAPLEVTAEEFAFTPTSWAVDAGEPFDVELVNEGSIPHEWAVLRLGEDIASGAEFGEDRVLFELEEVPGGETGTGTFVVEEPGTYQVICAIDGHFDSGMAGTLEAR